MIFDTHGIIHGPDAPSGHHRILWQDGTLTAVKGQSKWIKELPKPEGRGRSFQMGDYTLTASGCKCSCGPTCKKPRRELLDG